MRRFFTTVYLLGGGMFIQQITHTTASALLGNGEEVNLIMNVMCGSILSFDTATGCPGVSTKKGEIPWLGQEMWSEILHTLARSVEPKN